eukprot:3875846-Prymnesium_polylepis.2
MAPPDVDAFLAAHRADMENAISIAFTSAMQACPPQPLPFLADRIGEYARSNARAISLPEELPASGTAAPSPAADDMY